MNSKVKKTSEICLQIGLDENQKPVHIAWKSEDDPNNKDFRECKAFALSLFEKEFKETLKIDLWTLDMQMAEMDRFVFNTLKGLTDSYFKATNNGQLANEMQRFVAYFGEKTGIIETNES